MRKIPIYTEAMLTWGVPGVITLMRFGPIADNGRSPGFAPDVEITVEALVRFWCGDNNEHCERLADWASLARHGERAANASGWLGALPTDRGWTEAQARTYIEAQAVAMRRYGDALRARKSTLDLIYCDHDHGRDKVYAKCDRLDRILYASGAFDRNTTRCIDRDVWWGDGFAADENGLMNHVRPIDGRTVMVNWYLRTDIGVDLDVQAARNIDAAERALKAGYDVFALVRGARFGRLSAAVEEAVPYDEKTAAAYDAQARWARMREREIGSGHGEFLGVIYFAEHGQGIYPLKDPGADYTIQPPAGTWDNKAKANAPHAMADMIATAKAWCGGGSAS